MSSITSISSVAAGAVSQNLAAAASSALAVGQNPTPGGVAGQDQAGTLAQASLAVLKDTLNLEASSGMQVAQMISQTGGVDTYA